MYRIKILLMAFGILSLFGISCKNIYSIYAYHALFFK